MWLLCADLGPSAVKPTEVAGSWDGPLASGGRGERGGGWAARPAHSVGAVQGGSRLEALLTDGSGKRDT